MMQIFLKIIKITVKTLLIILTSLLIALASYYIYYKITSQKVTLIDRKDGKQVSAVIYPQELSATKGLIVVSHGAGGSEQNLGYLMKALQEDGYFIIVAGHAESGLIPLLTHMLKEGSPEGIISLATKQTAYEARMMDLDAIMNWVPDELKSKPKILIGFSMGASTVLLESGAVNKIGIVAQDRFDAYVALSPPEPNAVFPLNATKDIAKPMLMLSGTMDYALPINDWKPRKEAFNGMTGGCKWFGVIDGTNHLHFAGVGDSKRTEELTISTTRSFLKGLAEKSCVLPSDLKNIELSMKK